MKRILLVTSFLLVVLAACDQSQPPTQQAVTPLSTQPASGSSGSTTPEQVMVGVPNWPPAIEEGVSVTLAQDQFATNVILAIDTSGSMSGIGGYCDGKEKFGEAVKASHNFLATVPSEAYVGVIEFGGSANIVAPLTRDRSVVKQAIDNLRSGGSTPMAHAIELANDAFVQKGQVQSGNGTYHLVILGDGAPDNEQRTAAWLDHMVWQSPVAVHAIGFCAKLEILERTGMNYKTVNNADELAQAFAEVLAEVDVSGNGTVDMGSW